MPRAYTHWETSTVYNLKWKSPIALTHFIFKLCRFSIGKNCMQSWMKCSWNIRSLAWNRFGLFANYTVVYLICYVLMPRPSFSLLLYNIFSLGFDWLKFVLGLFSSSHWHYFMMLNFLLRFADFARTLQDSFSVSKL